MERSADGPAREVHLHAGGQGFWTARMAARLGARVELVGPFSGEPGIALRALVEAEGITVRAISSTPPNGVWVSDGAEGEIASIADVAVPRLARHESDELVTAMLASGLGVRVAVLTGSPPGVLDATRYSGLAHDLHALGGIVLADLSGDQLLHAVEGGLDVLKVSHDELVEGGLAEDESPAALVAAAERLNRRGAGVVVVTRAGEAMLAVSPRGVSLVETPEFHPVNRRGAGDSVTGALAWALARGARVEEALRWAAAAGALNVTRHGLGSGDTVAIGRLAERVRVRERPPG